jgi:hypothetical protein
LPEGVSILGCVAWIVIRVVIVEVANGFGDMVVIVAYRQLRQVSPLASSEARARVSAAG